MKTTVALRSSKDRLRYSLTFEASLLALLIPAGAVFFDKPVSEIGVLGLMLCSKALLVSLAYNWVFDHFDARRGRVSSDRTAAARIVHAVGFELALLVTSMPIYMWWLEVSLYQALMADIVVTSFVVGCTYLFTLAYDRVFPVQPRQSFAAAHA